MFDLKKLKTPTEYLNFYTKVFAISPTSLNNECQENEDC